MHCTLLFGSVLASQHADPGVLYVRSCRGTPLVLVLAFLALASTLLDQVLMALTFLYLRRRRPHRLCLALGLHAAVAAMVRDDAAGGTSERMLNHLLTLLVDSPSHHAIALPFATTDPIQRAVGRLQGRAAPRLHRDGGRGGPGRARAPAAVAGGRRLDIGKQEMCPKNVYRAKIKKRRKSGALFGMGKASCLLSLFVSNTAFS